MRILNITNQIPYPAMSGAPLRTYNVLRGLSKDNEVYLVAFATTEERQEGVAHLLEFCREVVTANPISLKESKSLGKALKSLLRGEPLELRLAFSDELAQKIQLLTDRVDFDIVQIEHGRMGLYLEALPEPLRKRTVWVLHDIDFDKFKRIARIERGKSTKMRAWIHAVMMRMWQPKFAALFGRCVTMSEADRQRLLAVNGALRVGVSPNGVDTNQNYRLPDDGDAGELLFIGNMSYQPNVDAVAYFCGEVLPLIRAKFSMAKLRIVGINPAESVKKLEGNGIFVTGAVPDVLPYYRKSKVCVAPLRAGSGTRLKILEAMALGRPVVSTSIGCEGLDVVNGEHILIADDPELFASHVLRLLTDKELRTTMATKAREFVVSTYDWNVIVNKLKEDFAETTRNGALAPL